MKSFYTALFLCLSASPTLANDQALCRSIHAASKEMVAATEGQIDALRQIRFSDSVTVLNIEDRNTAYDAERARNQTIDALSNFLVSQKQFLGALERCS